MSVETEERNDRRISWLFQGIVGILLMLVSYLLVQNLERMDFAIAQNRLDNQQMRLDFTEFSSGAIGNRFTQQDWRKEGAALKSEIKREIEASHADIQRQLDALKAKH